MKILESLGIGLVLLIGAVLIFFEVPTDGILTFFKFFVVCAMGGFGIALCLGYFLGYKTHASTVEKSAPKYPHHVCEYDSNCKCKICFNEMHTYEFIETTPSAGVGSPDFDHYKCRKCGKKRAIPSKMGYDHYIENKI